jgi:hypothetical protein
MPRTLKKTRIRGLPAKVLLSQRQDATGSFPTIWRTSSDNRTGRYPAFYNADKEIDYSYQPKEVLANRPILETCQYEEKEKTFSSLAPGYTITVTFGTPFRSIPVVVITDINSSDDAVANPYFMEITNSSFKISFSDDWINGSFVYRAMDNTNGEPRRVERAPRLPGVYTTAISYCGSMSNQFVGTFSINNSIDPHYYNILPTEQFVTFMEVDPPNYLVDVSGSAEGNSQIVTVTATEAVVNPYNYIGYKHHPMVPTGLVYPIMMFADAISSSLSPEDAAELVGELVSETTTQIVASGAMKRNISDTFVTYTPGQDIQPFKDFANPEVDAKLTGNPFYATGSAVSVTGEGFQQPLWSKNKIEVDVTPMTEQMIGTNMGSATDHYPMCYWNPVTSQYDGVGMGAGPATPLSPTIDQLSAYLHGQAIGFGACLGSGGSSPNDLQKNKAMCHPISTFGFPYDQKFQPSKKQQILMEDYISEPFLLEKIVVELNCSLSTNAITSTVAPEGSNTAIWSFFILNSRPTQPNVEVGSQTIYYGLSGEMSLRNFITTSISEKTTCDLVTYSQVSFFDLENGVRGPVRDQIVPITKKDTYSFWTGELIMSSSVKTPIQYPKGILSGFPGYYAYIDNLRLSGRNQVNEINGRDWKNSFSSPNITGYYTDPSFGGINTPILDSFSKENPYLLLPNDKLTFGWHMPMKFSNFTPLTEISSISFFTTGINKIILYGSTLRVNPETNQLEEHHETLNQLLSSENIHEVITG